jgi:lysophospholipase L1-like esterase
MKRFVPLLGAITVATIHFSVRAAEPAPAAAVAGSRFQLPATDDGLPGAGPIRRFDWFQKLWTERRSVWASRVQQDQGAIVFLGDSITQGWGDTIGAMFPGVKVANRGISGDTTRGVLIRLQEDVLALKPRGIVLLIGTNDLEEGAEPEIAASNIKLILAALKAHNATMPVVLCNVFPSSPTKKRPANQIRAINRLLFEATKDEPQVTLVDTFALFANGQGEAKTEEFPDLLHPNGIGYAKWEKTLRPIMENIGLIEAWSDEFTPEPGFVSLFNGRDFTGWGYPDAAALNGKTATDDGRFMVKNGRIVVTVARVERAYKRVSTTQLFPKDFVLKLEFRASPNADSGIFVRGPQLQCRDYLIAGPYMGLKNYRPLDWNEIVVTVKGGLAHCTCNGEVLIDAMPVPATGPIALESDHGQMEYRRVRVQEAR